MGSLSYLQKENFLVATQVLEFRLKIIPRRQKIKKIQQDIKRLTYLFRLAVTLIFRCFRHLSAL